MQHSFQPGCSGSLGNRPVRNVVRSMLGVLAGSLAIAAEAPAPAMPTPPVTIPVEMAFDGTLAVSVSDAGGKLLRRVCSEEHRAHGQLAQGWDLRDDDGNLVGPGTYKWTAVTVPEIKLTFEGTVNNGGQPGWFCPAPGKGGGGWMADHSPPTAACAVGDLVFLGSPCAESGHSAIAVDHDGNKVWGTTMIGGPFQGADRIASDGRYAYLANASVVVRVDPADGFAQKELIRFAYTQDLPGPAGGFGGGHGDIAIKGDRLVMAIDSPSVHLRGATDSGMVDYAACQPPVPTRDGDEDNYSSAQRWQSALGLLGAQSSSTHAWLGPVLPDGPLAGTFTVVFRKPVPIASLLLSDAAAEAWVLRPDADPAAAGIANGGPAAGMDDAKGDGDPLNEDLWQPLHVGGKDAAGTVLASLDTPLHTRALRFKTAKRLTFALPFDRRYTDVSAAATVASADGKTAPGGAWQVARDPAKLPISPSSQPAMVMVWPAAQRLRGVALVDPNEAYFAVDVWTGATAPDAKTCATQDAWREVGTVTAQMFGPRPQHATVRLVDFGEEVATAAVRVRAFRPAGNRGYMGYEGLPVTGAHNASFARMVAFQPQGGDLADLPPDLSQRLSEYRIKPDGGLEVVRHMALPHPGWLAFAPDGTLYAESRDAVVTVDTATGAVHPVIPASALNGPAGMTFDRDGHLLLTQAGGNSVTVHDRDGKLLRTIGKTGLREVGPFDPLRFRSPGAVAVASDGKVWIAEMSMTPKRISRWSADGATFEKEFFGPSEYGSGGWIDPRDPSLLYYRGMKFRFDWQTRTSKLESFVFAAGEGPCLRTAAPDRPHYIGERRYLLGDPGSIASICIEKDGKALPVAAAGNLGAWGDVDADPALRAAFASMNRGALGFVWSDRNGDRKAEPDEVQVVGASPLHASAGPFFDRVGDDLSLHFEDCRLRPTGFTADGVPLYDAAKLETGLPRGLAWSDADGSSLVTGNDGVTFTGPDGRTPRWFYPDRFSGVHGSHRIGYDRPAGMLVGTDHLIGHFPVGKDGEELYVVAGNHGDWFTFTHDGILAACLSGGPLDHGKRFWTMPDFTPGRTDLSGLCVGEEHFGGSVVRTADGRVLMVAGHNHNSIVRVDGLDQLRRQDGSITITADDLQKTREYEVRRQIAERIKLGPRVITMPLSEDAGIQVDGKPTEWNSGNFVVIEDRYDETAKRRVTMASGGLAADGANLYITGMALDESPLLNSATDPTIAFKYGDAFDVSLGLDPAAKPGRSDAVVGDVRIVLAPLKSGPVAVAYLPRVAGTPPDQRRVFASTGRTEMDKVVVLSDAKVAFSRSAGGWTVEAAIPWSALGVEAPEAGHPLLADVGVLKSDQNGVATVMRVYWAGKGQTIVSDIASEARLTPALWGEVKVVAEDAPGIDAGGVKTR